MGHIRICEWVDCSQDITERPIQSHYCKAHQEIRRRESDRQSSLRRYHRNHGHEVTSTGKINLKTNCFKCKVEFIYNALKYQGEPPTLCLYCIEDLQLAALGEKRGKRLSLGERVNCLIVEDKPRDWFMVDGKLMASRMVI